MTDFTTRSTEEAKTYQLFAKYCEDNWSPTAAMLAGVFKAKHYAALPVKQIVAMVEAMNNCTILDEGVEIQKTLTKLARAKVLRSRVCSGRRFYEVNY